MHYTYVGNEKHLTVLDLVNSQTGILCMVLCCINLCCRPLVFFLQIWHDPDVAMVKNMATHTKKMK